MKGIVTKSTGSWYQVYIPEKDTILDARIRGTFRLQDIRDTNPVAIGDEVTLDRENGDIIISEIADRKNYIIRQAPKNKKLRHVIAANLDQAVVVASIAKPRTSSGFIDRFLVTAEAFNVPAIIVINKVDIYKKKDLEKMHHWVDVYKSIGYQVITTSTVTMEGIDEFKKALSGKRTLISGHSGVGKSTLLNLLDPSLDLATNRISKVHEKGMHTTTFSEMFLVKKIDAEIIDTPGIKEFGVLDIEEHELKNYFVEMVPYLNQCKYHSCLHVSEPECAVLEALDEGNIPEMRYINYLGILDNIQNRAKSWEYKRKK